MYKYHNRSANNKISYGSATYSSVKWFITDTQNIEKKVKSKGRWNLHGREDQTWE